MDFAALSALLSAFGLSASAGLNAYIPLLVVALTARFTPLITLSPPYDILTSGWVIGALVVLLVVEVLADKVPGIDHLNDLAGLVLRPAAGAVLFAASTGAVDAIDPRLAVIAGLLVAGATHGAKASARPLVTVSTGGVGNPVISTIEDIAALLTSIAAVVFPLFVGMVLLAFAAIVAWWLTWRRGRMAARTGAA